MTEKEFGLNDVVEMKNLILAVQMNGKSFEWEWISVLNVKAAAIA